MRLPIRLAIEAPFHEVLPVLTSALLDVGELWQQRVEGRGVVWALEGTQMEPCPTQLSLQPRHEDNGSWLEIEFPDEQQRKEMLVVTMEELIRILHHHGIAVSMLEEEVVASTPTLVVEEAAPPDASQVVILFASSASKSYAALSALLTSLVKWYGLELRSLTEFPGTVDELYAEVAAARVTLGAWESDIGRAALLQARAQGRPRVALAQESSALPEWLTVSVRYTAARESFVRALDKALSEILGAPERTLTARPEAERMRAERRRIYRRVALNSQAPLEQRYHAARVLMESGDGAKAAEVLGAIIVAPGAGTLAEEALAVLGSLGEAARPVLWYLDACTTEPRRALEIARYLARTGDPQTALFRLEWLVHHAEESLRLAALDAMGEVGNSAIPSFIAFAREAGDPRLRLQAAHWLHARRAATEQVIKTTTELAMQVTRPDIAARAVGLLGTMKEEEAHATLLMIAHHSPASEARLAAAEVFHHKGENDTARGVLLRLAQGTDNLAAGAALDRLLHVSEEALEDTEQLMVNATLKSIRLRAAELLSQPQQPELIQQAAARVFLALERPALARPVLARLALSADAIELRRWAAQQLVLLGPDVVEEVRSAFAVTIDPVAGQYLAEGLLSISQLPADKRLAANWLAHHSNLPRAVEVLGDLALSARVSGSDAVQATDD
ncbi:MAG: hypothetical protein H0T73_10330, partial [Ardenticatenales bacterium]|nr:hypothetical protein [Ardenticatenales bacterium]